MFKAVSYIQCILFLVYPNHYALVLPVQVYEFLTVQQFPTEYKIIVSSRSRILPCLSQTQHSVHTLSFRPIL